MSLAVSEIHHTGADADTLRCQKPVFQEAFPVGKGHPVPQIFRLYHIVFQKFVDPALRMQPLKTGCRQKFMHINSFPAACYDIGVCPEAAPFCVPDRRLYTRPASFRMEDSIPNSNAGMSCSSVW